MTGVVLFHALVGQRLNVEAVATRTRRLGHQVDADCRARLPAGEFDRLGGGDGALFLDDEGDGPAAVAVLLQHDIDGERRSLEYPGRRFHAGHLYVPAECFLPEPNCVDRDAPRL